MYCFRAHTKAGEVLNADAESFIELPRMEGNRVGIRLLPSKQVIMVSDLPEDFSIIEILHDGMQPRTIISEGTYKQLQESKAKAAAEAKAKEGAKPAGRGAKKKSRKTKMNASRAGSGMKSSNTRGAPVVEA